MEQSSLLDNIVKQNRTGLPLADFLKQVTHTYPFFTAAQFYLLQQMPKTGANYKSQAAKAAALFNNPHWLHFQLQQANAGIITPETLYGNTAALPADNTDNNDDAVIAAPGFTAAIVENVPQDLLTEDKAVEAVPEVQLMPAENEDNNDDEVLVTTPPVTEAPTAVSIAEERMQADSKGAELPTLTAEQLMLAENADNDDDSLPMEEEIAPIKITIPGPVPQQFDASAPAFEPMHLVDYFASQGIKLSDEVQTADKLGKQLKSFTEWLKTMKKIHTVATEANAGVSDMVIQTLAAKSNAEGEIVTEAMAEVLGQQGKAGKAIEVYQKLSLLNPAKSAFFAAKIEQLKG
jgi:hypothetical protein